jgi:VWFA-related protein
MALNRKLLLMAACLFACLLWVCAGAALAQKQKLPKPRQLDAGVSWRRDPATGELNPVTPGDSNSAPGAIRVTTQMVPVTCGVYNLDGAAIRALKRGDFRVYDDGVEQSIAYFDVSIEPASIALVIDASPSVLRNSEEMKQAARELVEGLAPADQVAVVDFSAHTYEQLDFSSDRELIDRAVARVDVRQLLGDVGGSNIYEAVYLTSAKVFLGSREGRKAIILLTDGQDSGLGLTLDPASASPRPGADNRLTFDDVVRRLAAADIQIFAVSTENRPKAMTPEWLAAHRDKTLLAPAAREWNIPAYTLYLAELVRRSGGQIYFFREAESLGDVFRRIAQRIGVEYTLGYYPAVGSASAGRPGWHQLRVEVAGHPDTTVIHRAAYYVPAAR